MLREVRLDIGRDEIFHRVRHDQKYPSCFLRSIDPDES